MLQVQAAIDEMKVVEEEAEDIGQPSTEAQQTIAEKRALTLQTEVVDTDFAKMKMILADMDPLCYDCKALEEALSYIVSIGGASQA